MVRLAAAALLAAMFLTPATAQEGRVFQTEVTEAYSKGEIRWRRSKESGADYLWKVRTVDGKITVCGAIAQYGNTYRRMTNDVIRDRRVEVNDRVVLQDISFFNRVSRDGLRPGATATCKVTGTDSIAGGYTAYMRGSDKRYRR